MAQIKDEAFYEQQQREAAAQLAALRRPKLEAALAAVEGVAGGVTDLVAHRNALPLESPARAALGNVISILTSAPGVVRNEIAALPKVAEE